MNINKKYLIPVLLVLLIPIVNGVDPLIWSNGVFYNTYNVNNITSGDSWTWITTPDLYFNESKLNQSIDSRSNGTGVFVPYSGWTGNVDGLGYNLSISYLDNGTDMFSLAELNFTPDLSIYYNKTEVYNKTETDILINNIQESPFIKTNVTRSTTPYINTTLMEAWV